MMKILVLDASYEQKVALICEGRIVSEKKSNESRADFFLKIVDDVLNDVNVKFDEVDKIAVNIGPGSFTGIRVALSVAKGLAVSKNLEIIPFTSFDFLQDKNNVVLAGFSDFVYLKEKNGDLSCVRISELESNEKFFVCDEKVLKMLEQKGFEAVLVEKNKFNQIQAIVDEKSVPISEIRPLYLRKSQAEIQREQKLHGGN